MSDKSVKVALAKGAAKICEAEKEAATSKSITKLDGTLAAATKRLVELHSQIMAGVRLTFDAAIEAGRILSSVRASRKGKWLRWLGESVPFSQRTAYNYIDLYERRGQLKLANVASVSEAYALLHAPPKHKRRDELAPVVEELEGIPEHITRKLFAAADDRPAAEPVPVTGAGNDREDAVTRHERPKGWTPSALAEGDLTDAELAALKPLRDHLAGAEQLRAKAILRAICQGALLGNHG
jgi:hypothetical protein